ncbi:glycoside hydrolase family 97 protein [Neptunitalea lumnitzerae]|uniref:Alpha-glucosidase n=1 Tax=Neptunitalea lumnitzerae TaxID=2965509 RepID=A0ABQ5MHC3_9FLAO|nr:glycoside hydrolase family 97 protein [Neptunitalea sp. Y10]GLB48327.1 alpha-glucosidase [Neptunitalea sp. Y10]
MKNIAIKGLLCILLASCCPPENSKPSTTIESPDESISVHTGIKKDSTAYYLVYKNNQVVIDTSVLGLERKDENFASKLSMQSFSDISKIEDTYTLTHGKQSNITYTANQKTITLVNEHEQQLQIVFSVSNDGLGFKYVFPESSEDVKYITDEKTTFNFPENTKAWLQPLAKAKTGWEHTNPSYEEHYKKGISVDTPSDIGEGWIYPALFNTAENMWAAITETHLEANYAGSHLKYSKEDKALKLTFPQPEEKMTDGALNPESKLPWETPWRVIALGTLETVTNSTLGTDLAKPAITEDTDYIKPGLASWSWAILKDDSITYDITKEFIDYAADMNWGYCLIDVNWDTRIGDDGIKELVAYGKEKNVQLILWYNSAGDWNTTPYEPKDRFTTAEKREAEFKKLSDWGIGGVKIDFFGGDGQSYMEYYHQILTSAAKHHILVNFHGTTLPRGWQRTYPNLMTMEAIKGFEFISFGQPDADEAPSHCAMLPYTRNLFDPMDFTPMALDTIPGIHRRTTAAFELALPTLFLSGIQHIAETPNGMAKMPEYVKNYLRDIPTDWDQSKYLAGYPGKDAIIARRKGETWFITGINGENKVKEMTIDLSFIPSKNGYMITDGTSTKFEQTEISNTETTITMQPYGGFVIKI